MVEQLKETPDKEIDIDVATRALEQIAEVMALLKTNPHIAAADLLKLEQKFSRCKDKITSLSQKNQESAASVPRNDPIFREAEAVVARKAK